MQMQQLNDWKSHPISRVLFKVLAQRRQQYVDSLAKGVFLQDSNPLNKINDSVGAIRELDGILSLQVIRDEELDYDY